MANLFPDKPASPEPTVVKLEQARKPIACAFEAREVTRNNPLPQDLQVKMDVFCRKQYQLWKNARVQHGPESPETRRLVTAVINHSQNWNDFRDSLGMNPDIDTEPDVNQDRGIIIFATDTQTGDVIGFNTIFLSNQKIPEATGVYVGVSADEQYARRGLGLRLTALNNLVLLHKGVQSYVGSVWEGTLRMLSKSSHVSLDHLAQASGNSDTPTNSSPHKVRVSLTNENVSGLCESMGIDPSQNPLTTIQTVKI